MNAISTGLLNPFEKTKLCLHILTPFEKYQDLAGVFSYDPEEKHIYFNLNGVKFNLKTEIMYVYNNLSNFHLRLEVITPFSYLSNMIMVGMYIGQAVSTIDSIFFFCWRQQKIRQWTLNFLLVHLLYYFSIFWLLPEMRSKSIIFQ